MATLKDRKLRALDLIPSTHLIAPDIDETFLDVTVAKSRIQDYAFSQGFAVVTLNHDRVQQILILVCTQHRTHTKNWPKTPIDEEKRINIKVSANDCPFCLRISQTKYDHVWRISKLDFDHNQIINPDPSNLMSIKTKTRIEKQPFHIQ